MSDAQREMTILEWANRLPVGHRARAELAELMEITRVMAIEDCESFCDYGCAFSEPDPEEEKTPCWPTRARNIIGTLRRDTQPTPQHLIDDAEASGYNSGEWSELIKKVQLGQ